MLDRLDSGGVAAPTHVPGTYRSPLPSTRSSNAVVPVRFHPADPPAATIASSVEVGPRVISPDSRASWMASDSRRAHARTPNVPTPSGWVSSEAMSKRDESRRWKGVGAMTVPGISCLRACASVVIVRAPWPAGIAIEASPLAAAWPAFARLAKTSWPVWRVARGSR